MSDPERDLNISVDVIDGHVDQRALQKAFAPVGGGGGDGGSLGKKGKNYSRKKNTQFSLLFVTAPGNMAS